MDMAKPKIRFNGYTEDWEQRKLGELVGIYDGVHQTPDYQDSGIMFLSVENIVTLKSEKYIAEEAFERDYKVYPEKGDILMTRIGDVGTTNVVETAEKVAFYVSLALLKPNGIDSYFLSNAMKTNAFQKGLRERTLVTAIPQKINKDEIGKIDIFITNNDEEQKKIGAYFSNLDHLITLHQRKCEQTKTLKKYMLQKMFPQDGEKVPQIRFEGFTEDWEQRELSEIALQTYGGGTPKTANEEFWKGNIPWIQSSDLIEERLFNVKPRKYISQEAISKSSTKLVPQNSIAIVTRVGVGKLAFMPFSYATSQDFLSLSELKIEPKFAVYALYKMMRLVSNEVQGTSIKGITKDELLAKEILIPDCEEQKKIGAYLHNLDHLITLHQRKCDELKEVKKFMLQNMFV